MKLQVQSYNNGGSTYNAEAEETAFRHYEITHPFGIAECTFYLADPTGAIAAKYNADANDVYLGVGKVTLEDPDGTDLFYGRILSATPDTDKRQCILYCRDWLDQLDEKQISYDMREDLDGNGVRKSEVTSDVDGTCQPVTQNFLLATADDGGAQTDESTACNNDTTNDMTLLPAVPAVNDYYAFGLDNKDDRILIDISTAGVGTWTLTWEYYGTVPGPGAGWYALSDVSDGTSGFTVSGESTVSWTPPPGPASWDNADPDGTGTAYWVRARVSAYTSITTQPKGKQAWQVQSLYDDSLTLVADSHNGKYLIFTNDIAGTKTISTGPYADTVDANITDDGSYDDVWEDDTNEHTAVADDTELQIDYDFHVNAELGSLYSSGPSAGQIKLKYMLKTAEADVTRTGYVRIKSAAEAYTTIHQMLFTDDTDQIRTVTIDIPAPQLSGFIDTLGEATIQIAADVGFGNNTTINVYQCLLKLTYSLTGTSSKYLITDTTTNSIVTAGNITYNGLGIYETAPYAVIKPIYKHLDTAESVGKSLFSDEAGELSGSGPDPIVALTAAATIEHTSGFSARQYVDKTYWQIVQDLARQDNAQCWMALGTVIVNWKSTWNDGVADETLTDADVNKWTMTQDYQTLVNSCTVYGMRIDDNELSATYSDATSIAKYNATRTRVIRDSGIVSEYDALERATAVVNQYNGVQKIITATIRGNTATAAHPKTIVLGDEIQITSTYLDLSSAWYVVQRFSYDSRTHLTTLLLHPRVSYGLQEDETMSTDSAMQMIRRGGEAKYIPPPVTDTVT